MHHLVERFNFWEVKIGIFQRGSQDISNGWLIYLLASHLWSTVSTNMSSPFERVAKNGKYIEQKDSIVSSLKNC
jgi:hypothetical protein